MELILEQIQQDKISKIYGHAPASGLDQILAQSIGVGQTVVSPSTI